MGESLSEGGDGGGVRFGRFELMDRLAVGGMAELYRARLAGHAKAAPLVIKRILPSLAANPRFRAMFEDEARIGARLRHANIARTLELGEHRGELYIAMELVDGIDVLELLREIASDRVTIAPELIAYIGCEVLEALSFAHEQRGPDGTALNIVHRDVSPANVLLSKSGDVKLVDFGIAKAVITGSHTQAGSVKGKYGYMSPEQVRGEPLDARSDLFSTAIVLSEALIGRRLFAAATDLDLLLLVRDADLSRLHACAETIPEGLYAILLRALSKDRTDRFADAMEMRAALQHWLRDVNADVGPKTVAAVVAEVYERVSARRKTVTAQAGTIPGDDTDAATGEYDDWEEEDIEVVGEWTGSDEAPIPDTVVELSRTLSESDIEIVPEDDGEDDEYEDEVIVAEQALPRSYVEEMDFSDHVRRPRRAAATRTSSRAGRDFARMRAVTLSPLPDKPTWTAAIDARSVLAVLFELAAGRETGTLRVASADARREVHVRDGRIIGVASDDPEERLGARLVADGAITDDELQAALDALPSEGGKLGSALVHLGFMSSLEVFRALTRQAQSRLVDMCAWTRGELSWHAGAAPLDPGFRVDVDILDVLVQAAMALPEGRVGAWRQSIVGQRAMRAPSCADLPAAFSIGAVGVVWNGLTAPQDATAVADDDASSRSLLLLVETGLVQLR